MTAQTHKQALRLDVDAEDLGRGLGGLVVAVLDVVHQLLERQALRRIDAGALTAEQVERLGEALIGLEEGIAELRDIFAVTDREIGLPFAVVDLEGQQPKESESCQ